MLHTFRFSGPTDDELESEVGEGVTTSVEATPAVHRVIDIANASALNDLKVSMRNRGWTYVGVGDLVP